MAQESKGMVGVGSRVRPRLKDTGAGNPQRNEKLERCVVRGVVVTPRKNDCGGVLLCGSCCVDVSGFVDSLGWLNKLNKHHFYITAIMPPSLISYCFGSALKFIGLKVL